MAEGGKTPDSPRASSKGSLESKERKDEEGSSTSDTSSIVDNIGKLLSRLGIRIPHSDSKETEEKETGAKLTIEEIAEQIKNGRRTKIIIMCGAGISTSAGIPDFRSPGSGLYDNLEKFDLPDPQCIFEISYFKRNPRPFYALAKELLPGLLKPTPCHYFIRLLHEKGHLMRVYTQNIDTLERIAGIPDEKIVEAHGTFHTSHCLQTTCHKEFTLEWMKEKIKSDELPKCPDCDTIIKPDIVFFGENLPARFFHLAEQDFKLCDLLIVMGTSLVVQPFASLVDRVPTETPRLLINKEKTGEIDPVLRSLGFHGGMDFSSKRNTRDVAWLGTCDDGCLLLSKLLDWKKELEDLIKNEHRKLEDQDQSSNTTSAL